MSAENLSYRLQRSPGTSLTWHDGRSQRSEGARAVKLLRQPGTEGAQVPAGLWGWHRPHGFEGERDPRRPPQEVFFCRVLSLIHI